jgi:hypothetical protein
MTNKIVPLPLGTPKINFQALMFFRKRDFTQKLLLGQSFLPIKQLCSSAAKLSLAGEQPQLKVKRGGLYLVRTLNKRFSAKFPI